MHSHVFNSVSNLAILMVRMYAYMYVQCMFALKIYAWTVLCITCKHLEGGLTGLYYCRHTIIVVLLAFTVFSFLPNWNTLPSNFWQWISRSVGCIPTNKPSIASCFSCALSVFYSPAWNAQSSKFWQWLSLPVLLALADYWSRGVWIILQVPLTPGLSQVINWIVLGGVWWVGQETSCPCSNHPNCHAITAQFASDGRYQQNQIRYDTEYFP